MTENYLQEAIEYETKNGSVELIKAAFSSLTRLLVEKSICTEKELQEAFLKEIKR